MEKMLTPKANQRVWAIHNNSGFNFSSDWMINLSAAVTKSTKTGAESDQVIKKQQTIVQFVLDFSLLDVSLRAWTWSMVIFSIATEVHRFWEISIPALFRQN